MQKGGRTTNPELIEYYLTAKKHITENGYASEIKAVLKRKFENLTPAEFLNEYVWVVLNSGMRNQVAEKIYNKLCDTKDINTVRHDGKRKAIEKAMDNYEQWFKDLQRAEDKIAYLESLHWIGGITKFHLARNIGLDVAKPDRHLVRLAERFGFADVHEMCDYVSEQTTDRVGVVDVVLWRYCNLGEPTINNTLTPKSKQTTLELGG